MRPDDVELRRNRRRGPLAGHALPATTFVALALLPAIAHATSMDGLAWVVVVWPPGVVGAIGMAVLSVTALAAKRPAPRLGGACVAVSAIAALGYPVWVLTWTGWGDELDLVVFTLVPHTVVAAACFALGLRARRAHPKGR